ncbi:MAG: hypothetical protein GY754_00305 [bacterium]|nr:hypothetical protein [bacterium]
MKKHLFITLIISFLFALISCSSANKKQEIDPMNIEGWLNGDTYQVFASARLKAEFVGLNEKKNEIRHAAVMVAKEKIFDQFMGLLDKSSKSYKFNKLKMGKIFLSAARKGEVIKEEFDSEWNCTILFRIQEKDLRKNVEELGGE